MPVKKFGCAVLVLAVLAIMSGGLSAGERQGPRISIPEPRFDFGMVRPGAQAEHLFVIQNTGDEVLEIQRVQPT